MDIVYISDFFLGETNGGAEQNDAELLNLLENAGHTVERVKSDNIPPNFVKNNKDKKFIISNFIYMFKRVRDELQELDIDYIIVEHDHKYLLTRDPSCYKESDYIAPKSELVNVPFYENAKAIICQSALHAEIVYENLKLDTIYNVAGNLWTKEALNLLESLSEVEKVENKSSIMQSRIAHKNTEGAVQYCRKINMDYEILEPQGHKDFLRAMSKNDTFVFFPQTVETLSRIVVEARMMNCKVKTNTNIGAASQAWFQLKGKDLIDVMRKKRKEIPELIINIFGDNNEDSTDRSEEKSE